MNDLEPWGAFGKGLAIEIKRIIAPLTEEIRALQARVAELKAALEARSIKYVGTFREGRVYDENSFVTYDGSVWHCNKRTSTAPGNGSASWQLAVKHGERGRDGKDAR